MLASGTSIRIDCRHTEYGISLEYRTGKLADRPSSCKRYGGAILTDVKYASKVREQVEVLPGFSTGQWR